jgi:hypothetical protein
MDDKGRGGRGDPYVHTRRYVPYLLPYVPTNWWNCSPVSSGVVDGWTPTELNVSSLPDHLTLLWHQWMEPWLNGWTPIK